MITARQATALTTYAKEEAARKHAKEHFEAEQIRLIEVGKELRLVPLFLEELEKSIKNCAAKEARSAYCKMPQLLQPETRQLLFNKLTELGFTVTTGIADVNWRRVTTFISKW